MTYKVTNKLNSRVMLSGIVFEANETKVLKIKPSSDKFIVEEIKDTHKISTGKDGGLKVEEIKSEKKPTKLKENKE